MENAKFRPKQNQNPCNIEMKWNLAQLITFQKYVRKQTDHQPIGL